LNILTCLKLRGAVRSLQKISCKKVYKHGDPWGYIGDPWGSMGIHWGSMGIHGGSIEEITKTSARKITYCVQYGSKYLTFHNFS
jgi:hypothetical protein